MKANTAKVLERVNTSGPVVITQNGEASAVLMGVRDYDRMQESLALLKTLSMGNKSMEEGRGVPAETVFARPRPCLPRLLPPLRRAGEKANVNSMNPPPAVVFRNVSFDRPDFSVLHDVSFSVPRGTFMLLIGPNGGGKTTLLRLMLGLLRPQSGNIEVLGGVPPESARAVGYVPQDANLNKDFPISVEEVAALGCAAGRQGRDASASALRRTGMWELRRRRIGDLSQGQRRRVLIARALALAPELLILDEPAAGLDVEGQAALNSLFAELRGEMTIVLVSHDVSASRNADLIGCVDKGLHLHGSEEFQSDMRRMGLQISLGRCPVEILQEQGPRSGSSSDNVCGMCGGNGLLTKTF